MRELLWMSVVAVLSLMTYGLLFCRSRSVAFLLALSVPLSVLLSLLYFIADIFTGQGLTSAVIFHVLNGFQNENDIGMAEFPELVALVLLVAAAVMGWLLLMERGRLRRIGKKGRFVLLESVVVLVALVLAVPLHPAVAEGRHLWSELAPRNHEILNQELKGIPNDVATKGHPRSLVYVYAESYERAFLDEHAFPNLASNLIELERGGLSIRGIGEAPLTNWTIAGKVASQCGMPLATISSAMNDPGLGRTSFLPGTSCTGDLLKSLGYHLVYVGGADKQFAGKGNFYKTHSFDEVVGLNELGGIIAPDFPRSKWGAYDQDVFRAGLAKFHELNASDQPFALVLLTTATHPPTGFPSPECRNVRYGDGSNGMLNAAKCSDVEIADFVRRVEADARDDVIVVVASDHLQRASGASSLFERKQLPRENLFFVRGLGEVGMRQRTATTMDLAPTVLTILDLPVEEVALGRNLLGEGKTMPEKYGKDEFYSMVESWRAGLWKAWEPKASGG